MARKAQGIEELQLLTGQFIDIQEYLDENTFNPSMFQAYLKQLQPSTSEVRRLTLAEILKRPEPPARKGQKRRSSVPKTGVVSRDEVIDDGEQKDETKKQKLTEIAKKAEDQKVNEPKRMRSNSVKRNFESKSDFKIERSKKSRSKKTKRNKI
jgi:hypothetical protein